MQDSRPAGFALAVMIEAKKEIPLSFLLATSIVFMNLSSPFPNPSAVTLVCKE
jgi:hypothetical protein